MIFRNIVGEATVRLVDTAQVVKVPSLAKWKGLIRVIEEFRGLSDQEDKTSAGTEL